MSRIAYFAWKQQLNDAEYKLAAAQAREKVLLETLKDYDGQADYENCKPLPASVLWEKRRFDALSQPTDDTALRAELKAERERLAVIAEKLGKELAEMNEDSSMKFVGGSIACAIRALEDN